MVQSICPVNNAVFIDMDVVATFVLWMMYNVNFFQDGK